MKKLYLILLLFVLPIMARAFEEVEIDGIRYLIDESSKWAGVINKEYSGNINIPSNFDYKDEKYYVKSIQNSAFKGCKDLQSIDLPMGIIDIQACAFSGCSSLVTVNIPESVEFIEGYTFEYCSSLTKITIPNAVKNIQSFSFRDCTSLKTVSMGNDIGTIGMYAFYGCSSLISVGIPDATTIIEQYAFYGCFGLKELTLGHGLIKIGNNAFGGCSGFTSLTIPNSVSEIDYSAFADCSGLTNLELGNCLTKIGTGAFSGCSGLTTISIPKSVKSIGASAFNGCNGLLSVHVNDLESWCSISFGDYGANPLYYAHHLYLNGEEITTLIIPQTINSINNYCFESCSGITSVYFHDYINLIGDYAFSGCLGLTSIVLPDAITSIGEAAFQRCSNLKAIKFASVRNIGNNAFRECENLSEIDFPSSLTSIGKYAFYGCAKISSVSLPNLKSISDYSFYNCSGITNISIGNGITTIGEFAFYGCNGINALELPNAITTIGNFSYSKCSGIKNISMGDNVMTIGNSAFDGCSSLESVHLSSKLSEISSNLFANCSKLENITIPDNVSIIWSDAFYGCTKLKSITIPDNVKRIGSLAFYGCIDLSNIVIGSGVEMIQDRAFANCYNIENLYCKNTDVPSTAFDAFKNSYIEYAVLHVPIQSIDLYSKTKPWSGFKFVTGIGVKYTLLYLIDSKEYKRYELECGTKIVSEEVQEKTGYTFSGWSEIPATMPAHDVTVTGTFNINKYKLIYKVDDVEHKSYEIEYGATITAEPAPTKEGYTFSGWSEIPATMPAHDVTITGSFSINKYKLTYQVDGVEYKTYEVEYNASITPEAEPTKEGYTFSGWSDIPTTMPAKDVTITGTFSINSYKLTYMIDDKVYKEMTYEYGATITPEPKPEGDYATFEWKDLPQTMPAHDVVVYASYTSGIVEVLMATQRNMRIYTPNGKKLNKPQKGLNIIVLDDGTVKKVIVK